MKVFRGEGMDILHIEGGEKLYGECEISSAKNSLLPILAGSIMCNGTVVINKCAYYTDVDYMIKILASLGAEVEKSDALYLNLRDANKFFVDEIYTKKVRSSIFMLGPLLSRFKQAKVAYPGGCNIGVRPIDLHLKGLRELNVKIEEKHGYIVCDGKNMKAGNIHLDFPSVGATENLVMASVLLKGRTTINNAAREPEIVDLQNFLNAMGARVGGAGTATIVVEGVEKLKSVVYTPIPDRIITGTYVLACAIAGGNVYLKNTNFEHNTALFSKLKQVGLKLSYKNGTLKVSCSGKLKSIPKIETQPYPGFATDLQSQVLALQSVSRGTSVICENLFETRYKMCNELIKMGADITLKDKMAIVKGVPKLYGANVVACDLRGGAGLVLAGLCADGYTTIEEAKHIDRGYYKIENDLSKLGARITRMDKML